MSYNLFLLLNVNHDKEAVLNHLSQRLEQTGSDSFCLDRVPDIFFSVEYLSDNNDKSLLIDIPFGAEEAVLKEVFDLMTFVEEKLQTQVFDPQLGKMLKSSDVKEISDNWKRLNLQALENYSDGHHFVRHFEIRDGKKTMVEAIRFKEETWQNYCSVALAYSRVGYAAEACKHFEQALELDPNNSGIFHALGVTYFNLRLYHKAKEALTQSLSIDPTNTVANNLIQDCDAKLASS